MAERVDAIILGSSPAGLTAAIHLARAGRRTLILDLPRAIEGVRLLSLPVAQETLGDIPRDASFMRAVTGVRRVSTHKKRFAATEIGTPSADDADLVSVEMDDFLALLGKVAEEAGAHRRSGFADLLRDETGRVRGIRTDDGAEIYAPVTIVADGENSASAQALDLREETLPSMQALYAHETWRVGEEHLNAQFHCDRRQGTLSLINGELLGGLPNGRAWMFAGTETLTLGVSLPREAAEAAHVSLDDCLNRILTHAAFARLFKGGKREHRVTETRLLGGLSMVRRLFGDGWLITGEAACLRDPRHPYELRMELTAGHAAGETALKALEIKDSGKLTLGLYKRMLMDSYLWPELKAAEEEAARREKNPDLDGYYPELFVRRQSLDLQAGTQARTQARQELEDQVRTERPLWELIKAGVKGARAFG